MNYDPNNEILEILKKHYKVVKNSDGSYTINTGSGTYSLKNVTGNDPFQPAITERRNTNIINPLGNIGEDDVRPRFNPKLEKKGKIKGMFPEQNDDSSSESNPLIGTDPIFPPRGKRKGPPEPDPDNEYFGGDMYYSKK